MGEALITQVMPLGIIGLFILFLLGFTCGYFYSKMLHHGKPLLLSNIKCGIQYVKVPFPEDYVFYKMEDGGIRLFKLTESDLKAMNVKEQPEEFFITKYGNFIVHKIRLSEQNANTEES